MIFGLESRIGIPREPFAPKLHNALIRSAAHDSFS
jgi:hypothetical protein